jgi:two-component sensor histidine kinase
MESQIRDDEVILVGLLQDISEQKAREYQGELVAREVSHRSKNLLSLVQAVANRTLKTAPENFPRLFSERLQSLGRTQDLLLTYDWRAIPIAKLVRSELEGIFDVMGTRISIGGPSLLLKAQAAQTIGMALHEHVTNAIKYGALSNDNGKVDLKWSVRRGSAKGGQQFTLTWMENGGPPVFQPMRRGFGSTVISDLVEATLKAHVTLRYDVTGFFWQVSCAAGDVVEPD